MQSSPTSTSSCLARRRQAAYWSVSVQNGRGSKEDVVAGGEKKTDDIVFLLGQLSKLRQGGGAILPSCKSMNCKIGFESRILKVEKQHNAALRATENILHWRLAR